MKGRLLLAVLAALVLVRSAPAHAQFVPEARPDSEQQEFVTTLLLGPETTLLGAVVAGGGTDLVEKQWFTRKGGTPSNLGISIGAGVGAAIAASWTQWSISKRFHPGSHLGAAAGATLGGAAAATLYFTTPANDTGNDQLLRLLGFLLLPSLGAYGGWHVGPEDGDYASVTPAPAWADHVGFATPKYDRVMETVSVRF